MSAGAFGRVKPPYGGAQNCANGLCLELLTELRGAYLFLEKATGRGVIMCGLCVPILEAHFRHQFTRAEVTR